MGYCDSCKVNKAEIHVTMRVELFSTVSKRTKIIHFWLCDDCERKNRLFLEHRYGRESRVARAMTPTPEWQTA